MTQLSAKFCPWRVMIVGLIILTTATGFAIAFAPQAEPIKNMIKTYGEPTLTKTSETATTIIGLKAATDFVQWAWKHPPKARPL
jgi:hypothetical protein